MSTLKCKVIVYQATSEKHHTGVFVQYAHDTKGTAYDFGYWTLTASLLEILTHRTSKKYHLGQKYYHLSVIPLVNWERFSKVRELIVLFEKVYEFKFQSGTPKSVAIAIIENGYFLDNTFYFIALNNCRHYVLRVMQRLTRHRLPTAQELQLIHAIHAIAFKVEYAMCMNCGTALHLHN
jgi:hypothetical protein